MTMKLSDGDLMIAEEYLRKSGVIHGGMNNPNHTSRAKDVLTHIFEQFKEMREFQKKTIAEHEARLNKAVINSL